MRAEYDKRSDVEELLIYGFEASLAKQNYMIKQIYSMIEDGYKNSAKRIKKAENDDEKNLA